MKNQNRIREAIRTMAMGTTTAGIIVLSFGDDLWEALAVD
jgi:hypothetical protein